MHLGAWPWVCTRLRCKHACLAMFLSADRLLVYKVLKLAIQFSLLAGLPAVLSFTGVLLCCCAALQKGRTNNLESKLMQELTGGGREHGNLASDRWAPAPMDRGAERWQLLLCWACHGRGSGGISSKREGPPPLRQARPIVHE